MSKVKTKAIVTIGGAPKVIYTDKVSVSDKITSIMTIMKDIESSGEMPRSETLNILNASNEGTVVLLGNDEVLEECVTIKHRADYTNIIWNEDFLRRELTDSELMVIVQGMIIDVAEMIGQKPMNVVATIMMGMKTENPTMRATISEATASKEDTANPLGNS